MDVNHEIPHLLPPRKRPFFLTILCLFSLVYFFIYTLLSVAGFCFSGWVNDAINLYAPVHRYAGTEVKLILGLLSVLFLAAFSGLIGIWKLRKWGYFIFGISDLSLASLQMFRPELSFTGIILLISLLFLFGFYFRRFR